MKTNLIEKIRNNSFLNRIKIELALITSTISANELIEMFQFYQFLMIFFVA